MSDKETPRIIFHYIKNGAFRALHVDGAIGSTSASGHIHCSVYSERPAIPRQVEYELNEAREITGSGEILEGKSGYVRELEADLVMTPEVARALASWLKLTADKLKPAKPRSKHKSLRGKKEIRK